MKSRIKMSDIARDFKVSTVTVSKALAGKDGVSEALRGDIRKKALELGYVYNSLPRGMLLGRHYNIGILIAGKYLGASSFYWIFYQNLLSELKKTPYLGILEVISLEDEANREPPASLRANKVDGFIVLGQLAAPYLATLADSGVNRVFLDFYSEIDGGDCVASNNFLGAYNLTKLLIEAGHQRIAFIGSIAATTSILDRYMGFCKVMVEANLPYGKAIEDRDASGLYPEIDLSGGHTAYVCNNDRLAGRVINQLRREGKEVPRDVSLVGFDNEGADVTGGIGVTSLEINIPAMCSLAVDLLIQRVENKGYTPRGQSFIDGKVIVKESIAAPGPGAPRSGPR
ncbi:MAG: LacI family DNA-binding transcriptional regulator [Treponema sp.]|jgi:LacI family transcriptional regulator|nr:LacI family DNA-binding transcriptional regulator [Treponema sp.]